MAEYISSSFVIYCLHLSLFISKCIWPFRNLGEDNSDLDINGILSPYWYGEKLKVDEDQEHEFKSIRASVVPVQKITEHCSVRSSALSLYSWLRSFGVSAFCILTLPQKYVNAFLNTNGGTIYFGVEDDGVVTGIPLNRMGRDDLRLRLDSVISGNTQQLLRYNLFLEIKPQVDPHLWCIEFIPVRFTPEEQKITPEYMIYYVVKVITKKGRAHVYQDPRGKALRSFSTN